MKDEIIKLTKLDVRPIHWDLDDLLPRNCPICNSSETELKFIRPDLLNLYFCTHCSTYYVNPAPTDRQLSEFYLNYDSHRSEFDVPKFILKKEILQAPLDSDYRVKTIQKLMELKSAKVFDIGFGRCRFLYSLKRYGAETFGNDFDPKSIEIAKYFGIDHIFNSDISELNFVDYFDLVTMNDLVEHPLNPLQLIEKAVRITKKGGIISIWTPNGGYASEQNGYLTFRVDLEHMQYFTNNSIKYLAEKFNLEILSYQEIFTPILHGISSEYTLMDKIRYNITTALKYVPGIIQLKNYLRKAKSQDLTDERDGGYIIFAILRKKQLNMKL